jgi:hypothetical protein
MELYLPESLPAAKTVAASKEYRTRYSAAYPWMNDSSTSVLTWLEVLP